MKRLITTLLLFVAIMARTNAQGAWPLHYQHGMGEFVEFGNIQYVWDEIVKGAPGQCENIKGGTGVKKIVSSLTSEYMVGQEIVSEFYPNGLIKRFTGLHIVEAKSDEQIFHYDEKWRLARVKSGDDVIALYFYDGNTGQLSKSIINGHSDFSYHYSSAGELDKIENEEVVYDIRNGQMELCSSKMYEPPLKKTTSCKYDSQGRIISLECTGPNEVNDFFMCVDTYTYFYSSSSATLPSKIEMKGHEYNVETKAIIPDSRWSRTLLLSYVFDNAGNWTQWKISDGGTNLLTCKRTITYYDANEVKQAMDKLEDSRNGNQESSDEEMWTF